MFGIVDYPAFVLAVLVFLVIPGPATFALLAATAKDGVRAGYATLLGVMIGDWVLMAAALVGVAALLAAHPLLFETMRWLGVAYLAWVGWQLLRSRAEQSATAVTVRSGRYLRQGLLITLINPKAIVFYMAFFPLFIDPRAYQGAVTLVALGATVSALAMLYCSLLIFGGHWLAQRLRQRPRVGSWFSRLAGASLIGFGARLALE